MIIVSIYMLYVVCVYINIYIYTQVIFQPARFHYPMAQKNVSTWSRSEAVDPKREGVLREASLHMTGKSEK